jgi:hypothetical protein
VEGKIIPSGFYPEHLLCDYEQGSLLDILGN